MDNSTHFFGFVDLNSWIVDNTLNRIVFGDQFREQSLGNYTVLVRLGSGTTRRTLLGLNSQNDSINALG